MRFLSLAVLILALMAASPARADELLVSAAISLREAFVKIGSDFEKEHPGAKVNFNFGASGQLAQQIERGAPADLFASASPKEIHDLVKKHLLVEQSIRTIASNRLVIITPRAGKRIKSIQELIQLDRVTIGNPDTVPAGKYAAEALTKEKIYAELLAQHKLVLAESVRQALAYVESANVSAGIVFSTDARISDRVTVCLGVPESDTEPILYPAALVSDSKHLELGRSFIDYLKSAAAASTLQSKGFLTAEK